MKFRYRILSIMLSVSFCTPLLCACSTNNAEKETATASEEILSYLLSEAEQTEPEKVIETSVPETEQMIIPKESIELELPQKSTEFSYRLASDLLEICTGVSFERSKERMNNAGFEVIFSKNFDKDGNDKSHTCAFMTGKKQMICGGKERTVILTEIRGTRSSEWYSNFNFAPSHNSDTEFAENFLTAASDVYSSLIEIISKEKEPIVIVCGHSRGAACANLVGVMLDRSKKADISDTYIYTFATPETVRGNEAKKKYDNIFNVINPCDFVTRVPLKEWGYSRAGTDIVLDANTGTLSKINNAVKILHGIVPDIRSYYTVHHSLYKSGTNNDGLTTYQLMMRLCSTLISPSGNGILSAGLLAMLLVSGDSDFSPIVTLLRSAVSAGGKYGIFTEHTPERYQKLISDRINNN